MTPDQQNFFAYTNDPVLNALARDMADKQGHLPDGVFSYGIRVRGNTIPFANVVRVKLVYKNQNETLTVYRQPTTPTANGRAVSILEPALSHADYPDESTYGRAKRLGILDTWTPYTTFEFTHGKFLTIKGQLAKEAYDGYGKFIFEKRSKARRS